MSGSSPASSIAAATASWLTPVSYEELLLRSSSSEPAADDLMKLDFPTLCIFRELCFFRVCNLDSWVRKVEDSLCLTVSSLFMVTCCTSFYFCLFF